jgi:molecular chaperone GrpE
MNEPQSDIPEDEPGTPEIDSLARIQTLEIELAQMKDHALRALAEAENARKRSIKDREDASKYAVTSFAKDILSVADNLRRALDSVPPELLSIDPRVKSVFEGIEATERELLRSFERAGIKKIDPMDEPFNPHFHEVMFEAEVPGKPAGIVIQVIETGYVLFDRLLRPARVGVAKDSGPADPGARVDTQA